VNANQRLDDAAALYLVIVLANDPFLAAHIRRSEDFQQDVVEVFGASFLSRKRPECLLTRGAYATPLAAESKVVSERFSIRSRGKRGVCVVDRNDYAG
jgi:hypothetical protein